MHAAWRQWLEHPMLKQLPHSLSSAYVSKETLYISTVSVMGGVRPSTLLHAPDSSRDELLSCIVRSRPKLR